MNEANSAGSPLSLMIHFKEMKDYRVDRTKKYELTSIIMIAICAVIAGANDWVDLAAWAVANKKWLRRFIALPNGTPSHDTFCRVFSRMYPDVFLKCFIAWTSEISRLVSNKVVSIDGKTLCRSHDKSSGKSPIHLVSAWASELQLSLGQVKIAEKSNEIMAIPELLHILDLKGCIITIDAMGCQKEIARRIIDKKADYVLALKSNHKDLYEATAFLFEDAEKNDYKGLKHTSIVTLEKNHGRIEKRKITVTNKIDGVISKSNWKGVKSLVRIESERSINGTTTTAIRYFITSLVNDAEKIAAIMRAHWGIENTLHWSLDVTFNEDQSRILKDHGPQNFALLRRLTFNLLKRDIYSKESIKTKRFRASFDRNYLQKILALGN